MRIFRPQLLSRTPRDECSQELGHRVWHTPDSMGTLRPPSWLAGGLTPRVLNVNPLIIIIIIFVSRALGRVSV
jgi:hypothetical protein